MFSPVKPQTHKCYSSLVNDPSITKVLAIRKLKVVSLCGRISLTGKFWFVMVNDGFMYVVVSCVSGGAQFRRRCEIRYIFCFSGCSGVRRWHAVWEVATGIVCLVSYFSVKFNFNLIWISFVIWFESVSYLVSGFLIVWLFSI